MHPLDHGVWKNIAPSPLALKVVPDASPLPLQLLLLELPVLSRRFAHPRSAAGVVFVPFSFVAHPLPAVSAPSYYSSKLNPSDYSLLKTSVRSSKPYPSLVCRTKTLIPLQHVVVRAMVHPQDVLAAGGESRRTVSRVR